MSYISYFLVAALQPQLGMELASQAQNVHQKVVQPQVLVPLGNNINQSCKKDKKDYIINFNLSFGVCCVFLVSTSGGSINQNCTYVRNPGSPSAYSATTDVQYTINKCDNCNNL